LKSHRKKQKRNKPETRPKGFFPENKEKTSAQIREIIEPLCEAEGIELVHIEYQRERRGRILRLYIDKPGGVTLDDCVNISHQSRDILGVNLENTGGYSLEVSSPGPDRPLGKKHDFERFKGNIARIKTTQAIEGKNKFKGVLLGISKEIVKLLINGKTVAIPFHTIIRARLVDYRPDSITFDLTGRG